MIDWNSFADVFRGHENFVLTTHVNPDGDGLGTEIALGLCLQQIRKNVRIINYSETPKNYTFLNTPALAFERFNESVHASVIAEADAIVVMDMNDEARLRTMGKHVLGSRAAKIILDHHLDPDDFAQYYIIDTDACASGEIGYRVIERLMGPNFTKEIATGLYTAIMTDTGSFRFPRTDPEVHQMAGHLLACGTDPTYVYENVYNQSSINRQRLLGKALGELRIEHDGRLGLLVVTRIMFEETGAREEDVEDFVQSTLAVQGTKMGILAVELRDGVKLSFRSKGNIPVNTLAEQYGGGGHKNAAGARVHNRALNEVVSEAVSRAKMYLESVS